MPTAAWAHSDAPDIVRARSRQLFQYMAGTELCSLSAATNLADRIEDSIRHCGWQTEEPLGTETELAGRFDAGRRMVRQAGRILSARGTIEVRRGKGGGFFVAKVARGAAAASLAHALGSAGQAKRHVGEARELLGPIMSEPGAASSLIRAFLDLLDSRDGAPSSVGPGPVHRAERLAEKIVRDFGAGTMDKGDIPIGSLHALGERYSSGLPVVIQAVRLLEDNGLVASRRGRCGGIFLLSSGPAASLRLVNAYLGSNAATIEECDRLVRALNIGLLDLAQRRRDEDARFDAVEGALHHMEAAATATEVGVRWYLLQRRLCDLADNPPLHLLVRSFAAFVILMRLQRTDLTSNEARELVGCSRQIVGGLRSRRSDGHRDAHLRCQQVLRQCW